MHRDGTQASRIAVRLFSSSATGKAQNMHRNTCKEARQNGATCLKAAKETLGMTRVFCILIRMLVSQV